ncbi:MAG: DNA-3-methyladenine glycosylase I [Alphaproteobacteria bacterium]|nr:DNA-3-methyladenine glycosylase I [Alphaproteobacteria bacterium]MBL6936351.1 DNA-3-methyladenine glycosylase I [Alphaproteobacteria bacterium]MBL7098598.1 DNA-3-methyladenine glycosylase I [Alphaproteobacteria bacterium]
MKDNVIRCPWSVKEQIYRDYHDDEWGVPEYDPRALYEKLVLDGFQAGLSWITILKKRENFRTAFDHFDPAKIARYGKRDVNRLLKNEGIIRSPAKINAAIKGAQLWLDIEEKEPGGFREFIWKHVDGTPKQNRFKTTKQVPAETKMSQALSKDLKQRGFNFVGPVIVYAFAQAVGMVNDHIVTCHRYELVAHLAH